MFALDPIKKTCFRSGSSLLLELEYEQPESLDLSLNLKQDKNKSRIHITDWTGSGSEPPSSHGHSTDFYKKQIVFNPFS